LNVPPGFRVADEAEVVLAFLRGEVNSRRFGDAARQALEEAERWSKPRDPER
jgi:hypothetical protein